MAFTTTEAALPRRPSHLPHLARVGSLCQTGTRARRGVFEEGERQRGKLHGAIDDTAISMAVGWPDKDVCVCSVTGGGEMGIVEGR